MSPLSVPHHRIILAVDIENSTMRTNSAKAVLRRAMYALIEECLAVCGVREDHRAPFVDRGDGILVLIHPVDDVPKTLLLGKVMPMLEALLSRHAEASPHAPLRLRTVLHAGEVHYDGRGYFGEALDVAFRLLNAAETKEMFRRSQAPLLLIVSDDIHRTVIRHGYDGIDQRAFVPAAYVMVGNQLRHGWIYLPAAIREEPAGPQEARPGDVSARP